jgi:hypothetical protein
MGIDVILASSVSSAWGGGRDFIKEPRAEDEKSWTSKSCPRRMVSRGDVRICLSWFALAGQGIQG